MKGLSDTVRHEIFRFKQFELIQSDDAFKVTTEACVFGAWVPAKPYKNILDIGTGTGLLALMLAQKCDAKIDAVEISNDACKIALENFTNSPWPHRLHLFNESIQSYASKTCKKYDLIVTNPPFYASSLQSPDKIKNTSKHQVALSFADLMNCIKSLLNQEGKCCVLLPSCSFDEFDKICMLNRLYKHEVNFIYSKPDKILRVMAAYQLYPTKAIKNQNLHIHDTSQNYSHEFVQLLKPYYMIF